MVKAKKFIYQKRFDGLPKKGDFKLVEEELPPLKDGEFLVEATYLSVDPYMRARARMIPVGDTFIGEQVGKIVESKSKEFPVGKYVAGGFGWRNYTISNCVAPTAQNTLNLPVTILPDFGKLPVSLGIGVLGMPGISAYFGFLEVIHPQAGETVVVTGAAGAVGSIVGQIAKIKGCYVVGITGSDEKGKWIVEELGFDKFVNYKDKDWLKKLQEYTPKGIDSYFDNVGGDISSEILYQMNPRGRTSVCGSISTYNASTIDAPKARIIQPALVGKQLRVEGFSFRNYVDRWSEGINQLQQWINEGKLKYKETVTEGFDNMIDAFIGMLEGSNFGKAIVKA